jgi:hypothetical protein
MLELYFIITALLYYFVGFMQKNNFYFLVAFLGILFACFDNQYLLGIKLLYCAFTALIYSLSFYLSIKDKEMPGLILSSIVLFSSFHILINWNTLLI